MKSTFIIAILLLHLPFTSIHSIETDKTQIRNSLDSLDKYTKTRSHTDGFQRNNAKCLDEKGISRFVPHSSI